VAQLRAWSIEHVPMMCIPKFGSWLLFADVSSIARQIERRSLSKPLLDPYQRQLREGGLSDTVRDDLEASSTPTLGRRRGAAPGGADAI